ncbi:hypothetical protein ACVWIQ_13275, partial [Enterococcus faecium]
DTVRDFILYLKLCNRTNNSMLSSGTTNPMLLARAQNEEVWIDKVAELSNNHYPVIEWKAEDISGDALRDIL